MARGEPSTKLYEAALRELEHFLLRTHAATARQVAEAFGCSRNTAHKRLDELYVRGRVRVLYDVVREGACGPKSVLYMIKIKSKEERRV